MPKEMQGLILCALLFLASSLAISRNRHLFIPGADDGLSIYPDVGLMFDIDVAHERMRTSDDDRICVISIANGPMALLPVIVDTSSAQETVIQCFLGPQTLLDLSRMAIPSGSILDVHLLTCGDVDSGVLQQQHVAVLRRPLPSAAALRLFVLKEVELRSVEAAEGVALRLEVKTDIPVSDTAAAEEEGFWQLQCQDDLDFKAAMASVDDGGNEEEDELPKQVLFLAAAIVSPGDDAGRSVFRLEVEIGQMVSRQIQWR